MSQPPELDMRQKFELIKKAAADFKRKNTSLEAELVQLKEEVVVKQEKINKLKEELNKLRNNSKSKQITNFLTGFLKEEDQPEENEEDEVNVNNELVKENEELKEKLNSLQNEKDSIYSQLNESIAEYDNIKIKYEKETEAIRKDAEMQIKKKESEMELKLNNLQKEIIDKNQIIAEQGRSIKGMSEICKNFDTQKFEFEKMINEYKKENEKLRSSEEEKTKVVIVLQKEHEELTQQAKEDKEEIAQLKEEIMQYKTIIENCFPISKDYIFIGSLIDAKTMKQKYKIELSFGKYKNGLYFKQQGQREKVFINKEIKFITKFKESENKVCICILTGGKQNNYYCQFTKKEVEYILKFYKDIKINPDSVENALMNASLGDYFY